MATFPTYSPSQHESCPVSHLCHDSSDLISPNIMGSTRIRRGCFEGPCDCPSLGGMVITQIMWPGNQTPPFSIFDLINGMHNASLHRFLARSLKVYVSPNIILFLFPISISIFYFGFRVLLNRRERYLSKIEMVC